jgi:hypothetical protein
MVDDDEVLSDPQFLEYAQHVLDDLVPKLKSTTVTLSLVPKGPADVKYAIELGLSIMMDKPIIALVAPGTKVPGKLAKVADDIVEFDENDPPATARRLYRALRRLGLPEKGS